MDRPDIEGIKERVAKATEGPWKFEVPFDREPNFNEAELSSADKGIIQSWDHEGYSSGIYIRQEDAEFIARSRQDIPALLEYVEQLEVISKWGRRLADYVEECYPGLKVTESIRDALNGLNTPTPPEKD